LERSTLRRLLDLGLFLAFDLLAGLALLLDLGFALAFGDDLDSLSDSVLDSELDSEVESELDSEPDLEGDFGKPRLAICDLGLNVTPGMAAACFFTEEEEDDEAITGTGWEEDEEAMITDPDWGEDGTAMTGTDWEVGEEVEDNAGEVDGNNEDEDEDEGEEEQEEEEEDEDEDEDEEEDEDEDEAPSPISLYGTGESGAGRIGRNLSPSLASRRVCPSMGTSLRSAGRVSKGPLLAGETSANCSQSMSALCSEYRNSKCCDRSSRLASR